MTHDQRRAAVLAAGIRSHYAFKSTAHIDRGEERRCHVCKDVDRTIGTASHIWQRTVQDVHPAVIELCEHCHDVAATASL
jgi:hypothetical protein